MEFGFTGSNFIVLGIVAIAFIIYYQLSKNNQTLRKVKRYGDMIQSDLQVFVEEKTNEIKDIGVELEVHQKTGKEILKRITQIEDQLLSRAPEMEAINEKITQYGQRIETLSELTTKVDAGMAEIHKESAFLDTVAKRVKTMASDIENLDKKMPDLLEKFKALNIETVDGVRDQLSQQWKAEVRDLLSSTDQIRQEVGQFEEFVQSLNQEKGQFLEQTRRELAQAIQGQLGEAEDSLIVHQRKIAEKGDEQLQGLKEQMASSLETLKAELEAGQKAIQEVAQGSQEDVRQAREELSQLLNVTAQKGEVLSQEVFSSLKKSIEDKVHTLEEGLQSQITQAEAKLSQGLSGLEQKIQEKEEEVTAISRDIEEENSLTGQKLENLRQRLDNDLGDLQLRIDSRIADFTGGVDSKMAVVQDSLAKLKDLEADLVQGKEKIKGELEGALKQTETELFLGMQKRIDEYQKNFHYRLESLEKVEKQYQGFEDNLKASLDKAHQGIQEDFKAFDAEMSARRAQEKDSIQAQMEALKESMDSLEGGLNSLKTKAYDNVSEKLQVFEDEFFADLTKRSSAMQEEIDSWKREVRQQLEENARLLSQNQETLGEEQRLELESRISEIQSANLGSLETIELQIAKYRGSVDKQLEGARKDMDTALANIKVELQEIHQSSATRFRQEIEAYQKGFQDSLESLQQQVDQGTGGAHATLEAYKDEFQTKITAYMAELDRWENKSQSTVRETEDALIQRFQNFRSELEGKMGEVVQNFEDERESYQGEAKANRLKVETELQDLSLRVEELKAGLTGEAEAALAKFHKESSDFALQFEKRSQVMEAELNQKITEYRQQLQRSKEELDDSHQNLFGRIQEEKKALETTIADIQAKVESFTEQTKLFERADGLKIELQEEIGILRAELESLDNKRKSLAEMDSQLVRLQKTNSEISEKLDRFFAEKKRIDSLEADFSRVISVSESVETRLQQVTQSHDTLQSIHNRIRQLEESEKEVMTRYERLERKKELLDSTTEGVDKNYDQMGQIEATLSQMSQDLKEIPQVVQSLQAQYRELASSRGDTETVMEKIKTLDSVLKDLENRLQEANKAREWLARTETRLEEVRNETKEHVELLGALTKDSKETRAGRGAPASDVRRMVVKLKHEGWKNEDIARATKLSLGEVELILELGMGVKG
jgi:chromosome segregation ATPase